MMEIQKNSAVEIPESKTVKNLRSRIEGFFSRCEQTITSQKIQDAAQAIQASKAPFSLKNGKVEGPSHKVAGLALKIQETWKQNSH